MSEKSAKKLTRRDAIKLLGAAAGATALANLPSKWSKPELISGVLPAHAQTSCIACTIEVVTAVGGVIGGGNDDGPFPDVLNWDGTAGSYVQWYCQAACIQVYLFLDTATSGSIRITTLSNQFTLDFDGGTPSHDVLIDLATGDYALDGAGSAGSCVWVNPDSEDRTAEARKWSK